jgi:flavin reductase (DIM6/NTAB) family NADH-FMN oxidoreductase RutF
MQFIANQLSDQEAYKLLIGCVVPRPIAWVSTISKEGVAN